MRIGIALPTLTGGDAVGNDALGMARTLRGHGHDVEFYAWNSRLAEPVRRLDELPTRLNHRDDVLIYHHSIGCEPGVKAIESMHCHRIVKYHNITPPSFFAASDKNLAGECEQGLKQVARLAKSRATIWADSLFNADHFRSFSFDRAIDELPPFHQVDQLLGVDPDANAVAAIDDWNTNILVVGRVVPNKNIPLAIRTFAEYRDLYDPRARLIVVGDRPIIPHAQEVDALIHELGLKGRVAITGKVSVAQLKALYLTADALLITSHHEGFCVPLIEAMGLRLPVVAVPNAAVPFTGGDAARYADAEPGLLAGALNHAIADRDEREAMLSRGWNRYRERFTNQAIGQRFQELFATATPSVEPHRS